MTQIRRDAERRTPALAPLVTVDEPLGAGGSWIIAHDGTPKARVSGAVATAAARFTGGRTAAEIAAELGSPWTAAEVESIAGRLAAAGLLAETDPGARRPRRAAGRIRFRPPLTVQWSFGDPTALFRILRPVARVVMGAPGAIVGGIVVLAGVVSAISGCADAVAVLERPVPLSVVVALTAAIVLTTVVHELGHGAVLSLFGGSPRRIGAMLFYLAPAFFCDVTDGWRLSRRTQRAAVALAGPAVHLLCAAIAAIAAHVTTASELRVALVLYALSCLAICLLNLLPFVQLDGYLALVAVLDHPYLRRDALHAADVAVARAVFGIRLTADGVTADAPALRERRGLLVCFGVLCRLFPIALVGVVLHRYVTSIAGLGVLPALAYFALLALVVGVAIRTAIRGVRALMARRPTLLRSIIGTLVIAAVGTASLLCPVRASHQGGVLVDGDGDGARLVLTDGQTPPPAGTVVQIESNGVLLSEHLGAATVSAAAPRREEADLSALVPISAAGLTTAAVTVELDRIDADLPRYARARIPDPGVRIVADWLLHTFLLRPLDAFGTEHG
ncbi:MAG: hypothetical protein J7484_03870 [Microbacterium sp.]|nr:hypothetical protein [Microbacterium sp.]